MSVIFQKKICFNDHVSGLFIGLLILWMVFPATGMAKSKTGPQYYLDNAIKLMHQRQIAKAYELLNYGIKKYPKAQGLYYQRAVIKQDSFQNWASAIKDYNMKLKLDRANQKNLSKVFYRKGLCLYQLNQISLAFKNFNRAIQYTPRYTKAYIARAKCYGKMGMKKKAIKDLKKSIEISSKYKKASESLMNKIILNQPY